MKPKLGISEKHLNKVIELLMSLLADEFILYTKTRKFHWNVSGNSFIELHVLFQKQYQELEASVDLMAERVNKLGGIAIGTLKEFLALTRLSESPSKHLTQKEMITQLLNDHETIIIQLRSDIEECIGKNNDAGTGDFLTGIMEQHETTSWVLRRYLG